MLFELKEIIQQAIINQEKGLKNVLITVVDLKGSSYRKPGVRMLISSDNSCTGAVSGGCVEKEMMRPLGHGANCATLTTNLSVSLC